MELIDRDALISEINDLFDYDGGIVLERVIETIKNAPEIENKSFDMGYDYGFTLRQKPASRIGFRARNGCRKSKNITFQTRCFATAIQAHLTLQDSKKTHLVKPYSAVKKKIYIIKSGKYCTGCLFQNFQR